MKTTTLLLLVLTLTPRCLAQDPAETPNRVVNGDSGGEFYGESGRLLDSYVGFSVNMLAAPELDRDTLPTPYGPISSRLYTLTSDDIFYTASAATYSEDVIRGLKIDPSKESQGLLEFFERGFKKIGVLKSRKKIHLDSAPGVELAFDSKPGSDQTVVFARIYAKERKVYAVIVRMSKTAYQSDAAAANRKIDSFLDSFEFADSTPPRQATESLSAAGDTLDDVEALANRYKLAYLSQDYATLVDLLDPALVTAAGGRNKLIAILRDEDGKNKAAGMTMHSFEINRPDRIHIGSTFQIAFLPTVLEATAHGIKLRSESYQVAYSRLGSDKWYLVDGTKMTRVQFTSMFPGFPKSLEIPKVTKTLQSTVAN